MQLPAGTTFDSRHGEAMSDDIPFDKRLDLVPGQVEEVMPGVRRVMADNPGPFTFKGTVSYIVGRGEVAIIDPGPDDARHIATLLDAVRNETVTHIVVTHTHRDHSPGAISSTVPGASVRLRLNGMSSAMDERVANGERNSKVRSE